MDEQRTIFQLFDPLGRRVEAEIDALGEADVEQSVDDLGRHSRRRIWSPRSTNVTLQLNSLKMAGELVGDVNRRRR